MIGRLANLVSKGFWPHVGPTIATGLTATGTSSQANAYALDAVEVAVFTTVALNSGARLPAAVTPGDTMFIVNRGANPLLVYPATGGTINAGAANASFSLTNAKTAMFVATTGGNWATLFSA